MALICVFWIFLGVNSIVGASRWPERIVGGEPANITEIPYQLSLEYVSGSTCCGAAIIHRYWAITAAHAVEGRDETSFRLRAGSSYRMMSGTLHYAQLVIKHPQFKKCAHNDYDVALIKVIEPFVYSDVAQNILMARRRPCPGTPAVASGWGYLNENDTVRPRHLQRVTVYIENQRKCKEAYASDLTPRMLCATVPGGTKDACNGDSGGPLEANGKLVGIVSWGIGCANIKYPGVYTDVAKVRKWVISTIRNNTSL